MSVSLFASLDVLRGSIPSPDESLSQFNLGQWLRDAGLSWFAFNPIIHAYALFILVGIVAAVLLTNYRLNKRGAEDWVVIDIALWAVPFGIIGGRFYHVFTHPDDYFGEGKNLLAIFYVWEGGLAIFGALILGAVGAYIGARRAGIRFTAFADALAPGLLLAQAFGRLGNYFNQELFGLPTDLPWGLEIDSSNPAFPTGLPEGTLFHPTFLYEILWNLAGVIVLLAADRAFRLQWGKLLGLYLIWYGAGRSFFESIRIDPSELFLGIRTNVWGAWAAVVLGLVIILVQRRRHPGLEPSVFVAGREPVALDSDGTYSDSDAPGKGAVANTDTHATSGAGTTSS